MPPAVMGRRTQSIETSQLGTKTTKINSEILFQCPSNKSCARQATPTCTFLASTIFTVTCRYMVLHKSPECEIWYEMMLKV